MSPSRSREAYTKPIGELEELLPKGNVRHIEYSNTIHYPELDRAVCEAQRGLPTPQLFL